jgi:DNA-binding HxlR family transcriptional regulator
MRYSELKRALGKITHKMLRDQLNELEKDGLILRKEYPQVPSKVEYSLTDLGESLMPVLHGICVWGMEHFDSN